MDSGARANHLRRINGVTGEFQSEIGFAGGVQFGGATGINAPATVGELAATNVGGKLGDAIGIGLAEYEEVIDVVGFEGGVGFEFAEPVAFFGLEGQEVVCAALDGAFEALSPALFTPSVMELALQPIRRSSALLTPFVPFPANHPAN